MDLAICGTRVNVLAASRLGRAEMTSNESPQNGVTTIVHDTAIIWMKSGLILRVF